MSNGVILAGLHSGSGKTAITCLVASALRMRGLSVQSFKVGPDYIDPGYHSHFTESPCINLDSWLMGKEQILKDVEKFVAGKIGVVEGVMGLFDGSSPANDEGSTIELARWLEWPIILIVPCGKVGRSIGASIQGFIHEAGPKRIIGLILNQIGGDAHAHYLTEALAHIDIPILGAIPHDDILHWPERHLGLQSHTELKLPNWHEMAKLGESVLDLSAISALVKPAQKRELENSNSSFKFRIGIAKDKAFHFYYPANLEFLKERHVELIEFSPLADSSIPSDLDGIIFGGGFPEVFVNQIADNVSMRTSIGQALNDGMPCYAECGGLMILTEKLINSEGVSYPMVGVVPGAVQMTKRLNNFGYCKCSPIGQEKETWHGHEFHYSSWQQEKNHANLWNVTKKNRGGPRKEGYQVQKTHASYVHLYFPSSHSVIDKVFNLK